MFRDEALAPKQRMKKHGELGFGFENSFELMVLNSGHLLQRGDIENLRNPDYVMSMNIDAKARKTPFFKSKSFVGIPPDKCVVIDMDKITSYLSEGRNTLIICQVDYSPHFSNIGTYVITTNKMQEIMTNNPKRLKIFHDYEKGRDISRFYVSTDEMEDFERIKFLFD